MNNLRIDVIVDTERRAASPINLKMAARVSGFAVGGILVLIVVLFCIRLSMAQRDLARLEDAWKQTEKRLTKARQYKAEVDKYRAVLAEIEAWNISRVEWHSQLVALQKIIPKTMQLTRLDISESQPETGGTAQREIRIVLTGRARGEAPEEDVERLRRSLLRSPGFAGLTDTAKVAYFGEDRSADAQKHHREFQIEAKFKPRKFARNEAPRR